jgi:hypothetical protein
MSLSFSHCKDAWRCAAAHLFEHAPFLTSAVHIAHAADVPRIALVKRRPKSGTSLAERECKDVKHRSIS